jgi:hypothetical protein
MGVDVEVGSMAEVVWGARVDGGRLTTPAGVGVEVSPPEAQAEMKIIPKRNTNHFPGNFVIFITGHPKSEVYLYRHTP